jgi:hypothetical protein
MIMFLTDTNKPTYMSSNGRVLDLTVGHKRTHRFTLLSLEVL